MPATFEPSSHVVGWGTLALINTGLAQGKNRSVLNRWEKLWQSRPDVVDCAFSTGD